MHIKELHICICLQFVSFEAATKVAWNILPEGVYNFHKPLTYSVCGGIAGCVSTIVVQPVDVIRTRLISQGNQKVSSYHKNIYHNIITLYCFCTEMNEMTVAHGFLISWYSSI